MRPSRSLLGALLLGMGCSALAPDPAGRELSGDGGSITVAELDLRTKNLADLYVQLIADACEGIKARSDSVETRRTAHQLMLQSATSAWDAVTSSHPLQELLDILLQIEFQVLIWVEENRARKVFGPEGGERLASALRSSRADIHLLARRALPDERIRRIQQMSRRWRKENPWVVSVVRFGPYLQEPGGTLVTQILSGFGILDLSRLNPLDPAAEKVGRVGDTADDAFYMAKRMPILLRWQAEAATYDVLLAVDAAAGDAKGILRDGPSLVRETTEAARALEGTFKALAMVTNPEKDAQAEEGPPGRPFDIREYASAAAQAASTAREARALLEEARALAGSSELTARIRQAGAQAERLLAQLLVSALLLLLVFFVLLAAYRAVADQLRDRRPRPPSS